MKFKIIFSLTLILTPLLAKAGDDFQYWQWLTVKKIDTKHVDLLTHGQYRWVDDATRTGLYLISERLVWDSFQNIKFQINYTRLQSKSPKKRYTFQNRYELEANPELRAGKWKWMNRNRVEFRHIENKGSDNTRSRHRLQVGRGPIFSNAEFFYDYRADQYNENRIIPLGWTGNIRKVIRIELFYMFQSVRSADWKTNQVLGTHITLAL